ncbi:MAG: BatA and WFA domain-containing protein [Planctomycetaceae bacterium]
MSFAAPMMLWWALLAIPIVIFYVLKVRVRRVPVSTLMFWEKVYEEKAPRSLWERLRHLSSLLLQLALLALLVIALADPVFDWEAKAARQVVLVLDNSASMQATDVSPSRLDAAKKTATGLLHGLRPRDRMAVLSAGTRPEVVVGMTGHVGTLREAIDAVPATDGPTRVAEAVALARRLLAGKRNGQIVVVTDAAFPQSKVIATAKDVTWLPVGGEAANVGITRFQVRRSLVDPIGYEVLAEVTNSGEEAVERRLDLELAGAVIDAVPLSLEAGEVWRQTFVKASVDGGELVATLANKEMDDAEGSAKSQAAGDALAVDDVARAILPVREPRPVYLVMQEGNRFLESVFQASPLVELQVVKALPQDRPADSLVVFHRTVPARLPDGPVLVVEPKSASDAWELGGKIEIPVVAKQAEDSPLLAHVKLAEAYLPEALKLTPKADLKPSVLAETASGDPLLFSAQRSNGKLLVLTVNLEKGDLPLRTAFPILLTNALAWYAEGAGELREAVAAGSLAEVNVKPDTRYLLHAPDGSTRLLTTSGETATIGPLDQAGVWRVVPQEAGNVAGVAIDEQAGVAEVTWPEGTLEVACNVADPTESDLSSKSETKSRDELTASGWAGRPVWFYLLVGVSLLIPAEWLLYQRRWIQ